MSDGRPELVTWLCAQLDEDEERAHAKAVEREGGYPPVWRPT